MRGSRKFCQRGSNSDFLVDEGREDPNSAKADHHRTDDRSSFNAGLVTLYFSRDPHKYCLETLYFCDFSRVAGGGGVLTPVPLWIRA